MSGSGGFGPEPGGAEPGAEAPLDELFDSFPSEVHEILREMFDEENLEKKTELARPLNWSVMSSFAELLREKGLRRSAALLERFVVTSFRYLISHNRKGREEYVEALRQPTLQPGSEQAAPRPE